MIQFGLLTAILDGWTFEEAVDIAYNNAKEKVVGFEN